MKKQILLLIAAAVFLVPIFALAEDFAIAPDLKMEGMERTWATGYAPTVSGSTMTLCLPVTSQSATGRVTVTLIPADSSASPFRTAQPTAYATSASGPWQLRLTMQMYRDRVNGDYPVTLRITGASASGAQLQTDIPLVIRIRDGQQPAAIVPEITGVSADLRVGEDATLTFTLRNPSAYAQMQGVTLSVTDASGDILPAVSDVLTLPSLLPGESRQVSVPLKVLPDAAVSLHALRFDLKWTALETPGSWTETFTLPITQEIRLEQGGVQLAPTILQGDMATLTLPLMNMGRADVTNTLVTLTLPGVAEGQSVLVGTIAPGETKTAKVTFTPGKTALGDVSGMVTVSCEDPWGNAESFTLPVSVTVEEAPVLAAAASVQTEAEDTQPAWLVWTTTAACGALLLAFILQGAVLRRKIRRLEEERL